MQRDRLVAIGLLTEREMNLLGPAFDRACPVEDAPELDELLRAIDKADDELRSRAKAPAGRT